MALVFTQADVNNLKAALVSGANEVTIGDRTVRYRTQSDLLKILKMAEEFLASNTSTVTSNLVQAKFSKGAK